MRAAKMLHCTVKTALPGQRRPRPEADTPPGAYIRHWTERAVSRRCGFGPEARLTTVGKRGEHCADDRNIASAGHPAGPRHLPFHPLWHSPRRGKRGIGPGGILLGATLADR